MKALLAIMVLPGCYVDFRPNVTHRLGPHGRTGFEMGAGIGGEVQRTDVRAGGGLFVGIRGPNPDYVAVGFEGHASVPITRPVDHLGNRILVVAHAAMAQAQPEAIGSDAPYDPSRAGFTANLERRDPWR
jgi:hypothetical protein